MCEITTTWFYFKKFASEVENWIIWLRTSAEINQTCEASNKSDNRRNFAVSHHSKQRWNQFMRTRWESIQGDFVKLNQSASERFVWILNILREISCLWIKIFENWLSTIKYSHKMINCTFKRESFARNIVVCLFDLVIYFINMRGCQI